MLKGVCHISLQPPKHLCAAKRSARPSSCTFIAAVEAISLYFMPASGGALSAPPEAETCLQIFAEA
jgi:hypothetical protein